MNFKFKLEAVRKTIGLIPSADANDVPDSRSWMSVRIVHREAEAVVEQQDQ